ncbi:RIP metalloprotease RseP [Cupriavidus sp. AU9028]|uniref:RIP metalloprotease RseP n=1 Tax=Cupriavidus sp. AU9028 TaxID=2871157 RepID=UPI001C94B772|nr:RIP metalloprotease RseP [Cupriavidus sp. AU9028]MBY4897989.1 RIP metalloprotease RseP [Cupriavidus sp. AU9028]
MQTLLAFIVALGILIYVHEMGHYLAARACGVKVLRFSIGFGRPLLRWVSRHPDRTEWTIAAIPLGGYVKMLDERDPERDPAVDARDLHRSFNRQPVGKRFVIVAAGPIANFLLAVVLYFVLFAGGMQEPAPVLAAPAAGSVAATAGVREGDRVLSLQAEGETEAEPVRSWNDLRMAVIEQGFGDASAVLNVRGVDGRERALTLPRLPETGDDPRADPLATLGLALKGGPVSIREVLPGSAAEQAGLRAGDRVLAWQGEPVSQASQLIRLVRASPDAQVTMEIERDGQRLSVPVRVQADAAQAGASASAAGGGLGAAVGNGKLGAALTQAVEMETVRDTPVRALLRAGAQVWDTSVLSLRLLGRMLIGQASLENLSGPLTVADYAGKAAGLGWQPFISFLALVSVSLGVLNLLPVPVLDGGHLLYYCVEFLTGRPVPDHWQAVLQKVGIACILLLTSLALFNDVSRLFLARS